MCVNTHTHQVEIPFLNKKDSTDIKKIMDKPILGNILTFEIIICFLSQTLRKEERTAHHTPPVLKMC